MEQITVLASEMVIVELNIYVGGESIKMTTCYWIFWMYHRLL